MPKSTKTVVWLIWAAVLFSHFLIAVFIFPTVLAITRKHHNLPLVLALNLVFGWTPAWLLVIVYAIQPPPGAQYRPRRRMHLPPVKMNVVETKPKTKSNSVIII